MKYIVMECRPAYAILMDEDSRVVRAANLHYTVGQTVTNPVLMQAQEEKTAHPHIRHSVMRAVAAAACVVLLTGGAYSSYNKNYRTDSVVLLASASGAEINLYLNRSGEVLYVSGENETGAALIETYSAEKKDSGTVMRELLAIQKEQGMIADGDTVSVYITAKKESDYNSYKTQLETDLADMNLTAEVKDRTEYTTAPVPQTAPVPAEPPVPEAPEPPAVTPPEPAQPGALPEPAAPHEEQGEKPVAPGQHPGKHEDSEILPHENPGQGIIPPHENSENEDADKPAAPPQPAEPPQPHVHDEGPGKHPHGGEKDDDNNDELEKNHPQFGLHPMPAVPQPEQPASEPEAPAAAAEADTE